MICTAFDRPHLAIKGFPGGSDSKESVCNAGDSGSIPESGRSPGEGPQRAGPACHVQCRARGFLLVPLVAVCIFHADGRLN